MTLNLDPQDVAARITGRTTIVPVHSSAGQRRSPSWPRSTCPCSRTRRRRSARPASPRPASARRSASTRRRTSSRSGTAVSSRARTASRGHRAQAALPRLARQAHLRARRDELRLDAIQAAALRVFLPQLAAGTARGARLLAVRRSWGSARWSSCRPTTRATSTTCSSSARPSGSGSPRPWTTPGSRPPRTTTPLHLQPGMAYLGYTPGLAAETERAAAENLALPMWGGSRSSSRSGSWRR